MLTNVESCANVVSTTFSCDHFFFLSLMHQVHIHVTMSQIHIVKDKYGNDITGRSWRKTHPFFNDLPFYSNIPRADCMSELLEESLGEGGGYKSLLLVSIYKFRFFFTRSNEV